MTHDELVDSFKAMREAIGTLSDLPTRTVEVMVRHDKIFDELAGMIEAQNAIIFAMYEAVIRTDRSRQTAFGAILSAQTRVQTGNVSLEYIDAFNCTIKNLLACVEHTKS